jgi:ubiquinone/menaquinone biosynthesis C-methylase UbiE
VVLAINKSKRFMLAKYDTWGVNYRELRRADPRIGAAISAALGEAATVLNVGAGTGSYEPDDRDVTAVEPSLAMIRGRAGSRARAIQAVAERLPFRDDAFDAAMAILTVHHWQDKSCGVCKPMMRATGLLSRADQVRIVGSDVVRAVGSRPR